MTKDQVDFLLQQQQQQQQGDQTNSSDEPIPMFQIVKPFHCHLIDNETSIEVLTCLIHLAEKSPSFSLDLVTLHRYGQPHYIYRMNVEIIQPAGTQSIILIFRTATLNKLTFQSWMHIKLLLEKIFRPTSYIHTWNSNQRDLLPLVTNYLLTENQLKQIQIIDLQKRFQYYFQRTFPNEFYPTVWSLASAIKTTFNECINLTEEQYQGMKLKIVNTLTFNPSVFRIVDCLAMTKLSTPIFLQWNTEQLLQYRKYHESNG